MPLVWAHAEYIKLCRSLADGKVFDMPPQPVQRYQVERRLSDLAIWRFNHKCQQIAAGKRLRIELPRPALVHWSTDNWETAKDLPSRDTALGLHVVDLPTAHLQPEEQVVFTVYWTLDEHWEGSNFLVTISAAQGTHA
jgi:glucoamylase